MDKNKALSMLGLARRAGRLSMGHDAALSAVAEKKASLLIFASDSSQRLKREFKTFAENHGLDIAILEPVITESEIYSSCGRKAGVLTVNDDNFSKKIISILEYEA